VEHAGEGSAAGLSAEDWFLWSRVDGKSAIRELFTLSGRPRQQTIEALYRLADAGLIELPNLTRRPDPTPTPPPVRAVTPRSGSVPAEAPEQLTPPDLGVPFDAFEVDPALLEGEGALPPRLRRVVAYLHAHLEQVTYYQLLGVDAKADTEGVKRAYYRFSKTLHPDRWFRQPLGALDMPLREVFAWISKAHRTLTDAKRRTEYDALLTQGLVGPWQKEEKRGKRRQDKSSKAQVGGGGHSLGRNVLLARARRHRSEGAHRQAVDCFRRALRLGPEDGLVLELVETQVEGAFELDAALKAVRGIGAGSAQNYAARLLEARILKTLGRRPEARTLLRAILAAQPNHAAAKAELLALDRD
jgi:tetratricopeptide (TPR) repeat protein